RETSTEWYAARQHAPQVWQSRAASKRSHAGQAGSTRAAAWRQRVPARQTQVPQLAAGEAIAAPDPWIAGCEVGVAAAAGSVGAGAAGRPVGCGAGGATTPCQIERSPPPRGS